MSNIQHSQSTWIIILVNLGLLSSFSILPSTVSNASTYRCEDQSGITVLTDSPAQLDKCTVLIEDSSFNSKTHNPRLTTDSFQQNSKQNQHEHSDFQEVEDTEDVLIEEPGKDSQQEKPEIVIVPVTPYGGSLLVTVQLNHTRQAQLILDTGATMTVLSNDVALDLGLIADTNTRLTTVNTAGGPIQVNITKISSIHAGAAQVKNVDVAIHDLPDSPAGIDGLLGMSFLNHFLVTLDTNQGQLHLKPRS